MGQKYRRLIFLYALKKHQPSHHFQARSKLAKELVALLETRPVHSDLRVELTLIGLDIYADQNRNSSVHSSQYSLSYFLLRSILTAEDPEAPIALNTCPGRPLRGFVSHQLA